jgi:sialidase-1
MILINYRIHHLCRMALKEPIFTDIFVSGTDGYSKYRIPSILTTKKGTILAFAEGRATMADMAENDIVLKRSEDNGKTWNNIQVVASDGKNSLNNPLCVEIEVSGRILLMYQRYPYPLKEREVTPGFNHEKALISYIIHSDDDGLTWTNPKDITRESKRPSIANTLSTGPGVGIQLKYGPKIGRILIPCNQGPWGKWKNYVLISDDQGESWRIGSITPQPGKKWGGNEVQIVELTDGKILMNSRFYDISIFGRRKHPRCRLAAYSEDAGETWSQLTPDTALISSCCQGSIIRYTSETEGDRNRILFSNPAVTRGRTTGTIQMSYDEGKTWPVSKLLVPKKYSYSCLTVLANNTIGVIFESDNDEGIWCMRFAQFSVEWLTDGKDHIES